MIETVVLRLLNYTILLICHGDWTEQVIYDKVRCALEEQNWYSSASDTLSGYVCSYFCLERSKEKFMRANVWWGSRKKI